MTTGTAMDMREQYFSLPPLPLVSVIITNHNYGRFLAQCVGSVAAQSYGLYECILVDDASTDESPEVIAELERRFGFLEVVRSDVPLKHLPAGREGLRHAKGELVVFLDADDYLHPDFLQYHVAAHLAVTEPIGFTSSNSFVVSEDRDGVYRVNSSGFFMERPESERQIYRKSLGDLPDAIKQAVVELATTSFFVDATETGWPWAATSAMMFRRRAVDLFIDVEGATYSLDAYLCRGINPVTGSVLFDLSLSYYRRHGDNVFMRETKLRNTVQFDLEMWRPRDSVINKNILAHIWRNEARFRGLFYDDWGFVKLIRVVSSYGGVNASLARSEARDLPFAYPQRWPIVSFIVVNRNYGAFLRTCIESIYRQSYRFFECIVVDNASTDGSRDVLGDLEREFDGLTVIRQAANDGQLAACKVGFEASTGAFVAFIDADDFLSSEFASVHVWAHLVSPIAVGFTSGDMWEVAGETITASSIRIEGWKDAKHVYQLPPRTMPRRVPAIGEIIDHEAPGLHVVKKTCVDWIWSPTSGSVYKRASVEPFITSSPWIAGFRLGADAYFNYAINALSGSLLIDRPMASYRVHGSNNFTKQTRLSGQMGFVNGTDPGAIAAFAALETIVSDFDRFWSRFETRTLIRGMATLLRKSTSRSPAFVRTVLRMVARNYFAFRVARSARAFRRNTTLQTYLSSDERR